MAGAMAAATTEARTPDGTDRGAENRPRAGRSPDRVAVTLFSLAAFLAVLALLAAQSRIGANPPRQQVIVVRRIYETTVVQTNTGSHANGGTLVTESVSSSGSTAVPAAPATRSS